jgi:methyltransferase-like protein
MSDQTNDNSDDENKSMKIVFAEGCFDDFDGTQEELDALVAQLTEMAESGELLENSTPVNLESEDDEELKEFIENVVEQSKEADKKYGFDDEGFVKFPFNNTRH